MIGEDAGGVWYILSKPDNSALSNIDLVGDNPCVTPDDCGLYQFVYEIDCMTCPGLVDRDTINWNVPCKECADNLDMILSGTTFKN